MVKLIAMLVCIHKPLQEFTRKIDGIAIILECCNIDDLNPFIKEWSVVCIRHLCDGNHENQEYIRSMKLQQTVQTTELSEMGLVVNLDQNNKVQVQKQL